MSIAAARIDRPDDRAQLDAGLAIAAHERELTFVALPAPRVQPAVLVETVRDVIVAWTASDFAAVGIGVARELRGRGESRWDQLIAAAAAAPVGRAVIDGEPVAPAALGVARPRWFGGAAFAPGAADRLPWLGFGDAWFALPRWTYVTAGGDAQLVLAVEPGEARDTARWHAELALLRAACTAPAVATAQPPVIELGRATAAEWRAQVVAITDAIARDACSKIVAARTCTVAFAGDVRTAGLFAALDGRHAECVRVLLRPPGAGALIAATPERLVRRAGATVTCDALAGTRRIASADAHAGTTASPDARAAVASSDARAATAHPDARAGTTASPDARAAVASSDARAATAHPDARAAAIAEASRELLASTKDRREHDLVVQAIRGALADIADVEAPAEPAVRVLRHVVHLHTPFRATLRAPEHLLALAARLHPTPAVGGTPQAVARDWIRSHEPVARGWYAAPVGWFDLSGDGELAVAIRSGLVTGNRAHLWAGAGIVAGSDPDRELAETELKLRAMLGALGADEAAR